MKIAVIIPFFQRTAGILSKAVDSVFAQNLPDGADPWIIIVDDASPIPAEDDLAHLAAADRARITVLHQPNGGPGDARNRALDLVADDGADYVAFLDSDDLWYPDHLNDALTALAAGTDFYFCDHCRFDAAKSYARTIPALTALRDPQTPGFDVLDHAGPVITVDSDAVLGAYLREYLSQTSTVVVRQSHVRQLRFDPELRGAGEDHMFWIGLVALGARVAISWRVNVYCGRGVNIYFDAFDFSTSRSVDRIGYLFLFWDKCNRLHVAAHHQQATAHMKHRYLRAYSFMFPRALLMGQRPNIGVFRMIWRQVPFMPMTMPFRFVSVLRHRREESRLW
jgi:succinoglycan biosynthesis protein ExoW